MKIRCMMQQGKSSDMILPVIGDKQHGSESVPDRITEILREPGYFFRTDTFELVRQDSLDLFDDLSVLLCVIPIDAFYPEHIDPSPGTRAPIIFPITVSKSIPA